jgi:serine protease inhibitor
VTDAVHLAYTLALHRVAASDPERNACWSPYSVASALGLVAVGARGMTRDELVVMLLGEKSGDLRALGQLLSKAAELAPPGPDEEEPVLEVVNALWTDASVDVRDDFEQELARWCRGTVRPAPFRRAPEEARQLINSDVARTTRGLIPELVPNGAIRADTRAALVNALYLKCAWRDRFLKGATRPRPFHASGGTVEAQTMELTASLGYAATDGWQVVSLPAVGGVEAVVLMPDTDLSTTEPELSAGSLGRLLNAPRHTQLRLRLPKVEVSIQAELSQPLGQLGVRTVFQDDADLSGISSKPLAVQSVLHESVLKLDEQGLEGAAATAVMFRLTSIQLGEPVRVDIDRPFLLVVRHVETGVIYFMARVVEP